MTPDYTRAATVAAQTLIRYAVDSAPVSPLPILKKIPGVLVVSYEQLSNDLGEDRQRVMTAFGLDKQDAFTSMTLRGGKPQYLVTYNARLSATLHQRALARELGHILLGHDDSVPETVRTEEAKCFANHLLCPRALIHMIQATNLRLTVEVLGNITGCYDHCLTCMRRIPATDVPPDLNRQIRKQFTPYFMNFFSFQRYASLSDGSALADFGTYMDGYKETV